MEDLFNVYEQAASGLQVKFFNTHINSAYDWWILPDELKTSFDSVTAKWCDITEKYWEIALFETKVRFKDWSSEGFAFDLGKFQKMKEKSKDIKNVKLYYLNFVTPTDKYYLFDVTDVKEDEFTSERWAKKTTAGDNTLVKKLNLDLKPQTAIMEGIISKLKPTLKPKSIDDRYLKINEYKKIKDYFRIIDTIK